MQVENGSFFPVEKTSCNGHCRVMEGRTKEVPLYILDQARIVG